MLEFYINHQKALIKNHSKRNVIVVNYENLINDTRVELEKLLKNLIFIIMIITKFLPRTCNQSVHCQALNTKNMIF